MGPPVGVAEKGDELSPVMAFSSEDTVVSGRRFPPSGTSPGGRSSRAADLSSSSWKKDSGTIDVKLKERSYLTGPTEGLEAM